MLYLLSYLYSIWAMNAKKTVVIGMLGTVLDAKAKSDRWEKWRPTVSICQQEDLLIHRLELLHQQRSAALAEMMIQDIKTVSPETVVRLHPVDFVNPWDFEEVYGRLHDFARGYPFDPEQEEYLVHITTGTHVAQICLFLLTESRHMPGKLLQTSPPKLKAAGDPGRYTIIDLDLSKYDRLASRFNQEVHDDLSFLKSGIETRSARFNRLIEQIERVAIHSHAPLLFTGSTGAGKSRLARRIYELKKSRRQIEGAFVEVNCATVRGDAAMSALFGHVKGAFTGAVRDRPGLLKTADGGMLFLDEVGELGPDEQAMLLRALEEKLFLPVGADGEVGSSFQLICGSNRDLKAAVARGEFREDLLARINLWTFHLPGLRERAEDIEPNLDFELDQFAGATGLRVTFNKEARQRFLDFAVSPQAAWTGNFRDLNGAVVRMATMASGGRITVEVVEQEIGRLQAAWRTVPAEGDGPDALLARLLGEGRTAELDRFDRVQLADVAAVCSQARNLSEAGRILFATSRQKKASPNDADRVRKHLLRFGLSWQDIQGYRGDAPSA
jgi:transcriptional regulatory protein RtcR